MFTDDDFISLGDAIGNVLAGLRQSRTSGTNVFYLDDYRRESRVIDRDLCQGFVMKERERVGCGRHSARTEINPATVR